jgi:hypothetical protein
MTKTSRKMLVPLSVTSKSNVFRFFTLDSHRRNLTFITFMIFFLQIQIYLIPTASVVFICDDDDIETSSSDGLLVKLFDSTRQSINDCIKMCDYVR